MKYGIRIALVLTILALAAQTTSAHFKLLEPGSWLIEDNRGDPQKAGPCGGTNTDWGKPTYMAGAGRGKHRPCSPGTKMAGAAETR